MKRRLGALFAALGVLLAIGAAAAIGSASPVTITSPRGGSTVTLHTTPYLAVAGNVSFAPSSAGTSRFFLRRDACGTTSDYPHLATTSATDGGDGCGLIFNSVVGVGGNADQGAFIDFPSSDGMPVAFDASRAVSGVISLSGLGLGAAQVDVTLTALVGGQAVTLGQTTSNLTVLAGPTASSSPVPFTITPDKTYAGADVQAMDLRVLVKGPFVYSGFIALSGASYVDVPSFAASVNKAVQVSVDDPTFANPVPARLSGSTWSVAIPTPAAGKHTIYAESTQGYDTSAPTSTTITVKR
jgi:hypothetical protein